MTMDDVRTLEHIVQNPTIVSSDAASDLVQQLADEPGEPDAFTSNDAMKVRTAAAFNVAEAKLDQAVADLQLLVSKSERMAIAEAQEHWRKYRAALESTALCRYDGGSHAVLAMILLGLAETERRTEEIRADIKERSAL